MVEHSAASPADAAFISGLWGDSEVQRLPKVRRDMVVAMAREHQPAPRVAYCFGEENAEELSPYGLEVRLLEKAGVVDFRQQGERRTTQRGVHNYGVSMWRHKLEILRLALENYRHVVWLDWDCWLHAPLPASFWDRLARGADIQAKMRQYKRRQCPWRKQDLRCVPSAAWIYLRNRSLADRMLEIHDEFPRWREEQAMAYAIDERIGGWQGAEVYAELGYEPYCFNVRGQLHQPEVYLFDAR